MKNDFEYKYSAPTSQERREIESIRNSYLNKPKGSDKLTRLRKLDSLVKNIPITISLIVGIVGLLIFGLGLAMVLEWNIMVWGIIVSVVGLVPISLAYPINNATEKYLKNKHSDEILKLSEELLNEK